jgi:DNA-binding IclR family transcriptional regulator
MNRPTDTPSPRLRPVRTRPAAAPGTDDAPGASSLTRLLQILDLFSVERPIVSVDDVTAGFGVAQSTAYRYLRELNDAGLVAPSGKGTYSLGRRIVELERLLQLSDPLLLAGRPVLESLHPYFDNRAFLLCTQHNGRVLCVHKAGSEDITWGERHMAIERGRGTTFPLFRGAGSQAILAHMAPHQIKSIFVTQVAAIAASGLGNSWKEFRTTLAQIRKQGYAQTVGRVSEGMFSIAVPILGSEGRVAGSLLMLGSRDELGAGHALVSTLQAKAAAIAAAMTDSAEGDA